MSCITLKAERADNPMSVSVAAAYNPMSVSVAAAYNPMDVIIGMVCPVSVIPRDFNDDFNNDFNI